MLSQNQILQIFSYLGHKDIAICEQVCSYWYECINSYNFQIRNIFRECFVESEQYFNWFLKKIQKHPLKELTLIDKTGFIDNTDFVQTLTQLEILIIDVQNIDILQQILNYSKNIQSIEIHMSITNKELELMSQLPKLQQLLLKIAKQYCEDVLKLSQFHNLQSISLRLYGLNSDEVLKMIANCSDTLVELELEAEDFDNQTILKILSLLNIKIVQKIYLFYFKEYNDNIIIKLSQFEKLQNLLIFQAYEISEYAMSELIKNKSFIELYLSQCDGITDKVLQMITNCSINLKKIDISWNTNISDEAVQHLLQNCKQLEQVKLVGCKLLTTNCFPQNFDGLFTRMKELDLEKCNQMNDNILRQIQKQFQYIRIINYYGYLVEDF